MKGFYITVNNGLLDPKHYQGISEAIWLFMWCLDKMTIINHETGIGEVLGGKPIRFEEVEADLGISRATYKRWLAILKKGKYIDTLRTPYGLKIKVFKAKKRFGRKVINEPSLGSDVSHQKSEIEPSNKTLQKDTTIKTLNNIAPQDGAGKEINDLIGFFEPVNPSFKTLYPNKTERKALERMLKEHGRKKIEWAIKNLSKTNGIEFAPVITSPYELEKKLGKLIAFYQRKKAESENKGIKINTL